MNSGAASNSCMKWVSWECAGMSYHHIVWAPAGRACRHSLGSYKMWDNLGKGCEWGFNYRWIAKPIGEKRRQWSWKWTHCSRNNHCPTKSMQSLHWHQQSIQLFFGLWSYPTTLQNISRTLHNITACYREILKVKCEANKQKLLNF
jgi:hypothetical protein